MDLSMIFAGVSQMPVLVKSDDTQKFDVEVMTQTVTLNSVPGETVDLAEASRLIGKRVRVRIIVEDE